LAELERGTPRGERSVGIDEVFGVAQWHRRERHHEHGREVAAHQRRAVRQDGGSTDYGEHDRPSGLRHHVDSYERSRATRGDTVSLWHKVSTQEDPEWTRRYHKDGDGQSYGGRVVVTLRNGEQVVDQIDVADAHPRGARPFGRDQYVEKFRVLAEPTLGLDECDRFLDLAVRLPELKPDEVRSLTMMATSLTSSDQPGIF
jgi:hypothetical protein